MRIIHGVLRWLSAAVVTVSVGLGAASAATAPSSVVERFHDVLLAVMKDASKLGYPGRFKTLSPEIARAFHLPAMARVAAGRYWGKLTPEQQKDLVGAFSRMTIATYAYRFDGYSGEQFRTVTSTELRPKTVLVKTELVKTDGEVVRLDYLVREFSSGWRVVDIFLKGTISELATRRSEYSSVLGRKGLDGLVSQIDRKVASYEAEGRGR